MSIIIFVIILLVLVIVHECGHFLTAKYFVPLFRKQKFGTIVNVSSMAGQRAVPGLAVYSAAKFGVIALSQAVAKENKDAGLKCFTVCPGGMNTEMRAKIFGKEEQKQIYNYDLRVLLIQDWRTDSVLSSTVPGIVIPQHNPQTASADAPCSSCLTTLAQRSRWP